MRSRGVSIVISHVAPNKNNEIYIARDFGDKYEKNSV